MKIHVSYQTGASSVNLKTREEWFKSIFYVGERRSDLKYLHDHPEIYNATWWQEEKVSESEFISDFTLILKESSLIGNVVTAEFISSIVQRVHRVPPLDFSKLQTTEVGDRELPFASTRVPFSRDLGPEQKQDRTSQSRLIRRDDQEIDSLFEPERRAVGINYQLENH